MFNDNSNRGKVYFTIVLLSLNNFYRSSRSPLLVRKILKERKQTTDKSNVPLQYFTTYFDSELQLLKYSFYGSSGMYQKL